MRGGRRAPVVVRQAQPDDTSALAVLFQDMARFYEETVHSADAFEEFIASLPVGIEFLIAEDLRSRSALGFAAFATLAPGPDLEAQLFLKDLYVSEQARLRGVGLSLMQGLADIAWRRGYSRIDWAVASRNAAALRLYDMIGGSPIDRLYYRLDGAALERLALGRAGAD
jgi:GNAT superfamily N-acetyltransferase